MKPQTGSKPVPVQLFVTPVVKSSEITQEQLGTAFRDNLARTEKFAKLSPAGYPVEPAFKQLDATVAMNVMLSNYTSPFYAASWILIVPMFFNGNRITVDSSMDVCIKDGPAVLKTYSAKKTVVFWRNSVGIAFVKLEMATSPRWAGPVIKDLIENVIRQIMADTDTFKK